MPDCSICERFSSCQLRAPGSGDRRLQYGRHARPGGCKDISSFRLGNRNERVQNRRIELGTAAVEQARDRLGVRKALPVAAI
jgi:hypothetical protein